MWYWEEEVNIINYGMLSKQINLYNIFILSDVYSILPVLQVN